MKTAVTILFCFLCSCSKKQVAEGPSPLEKEMQEVIADLNKERLKLKQLEQNQLEVKEIPLVLDFEAEIQEVRNTVMDLETIVTALTQEKFKADTSLK